MATDLQKTLLDAMRRDGRTDYAFARDSGLRVSAVQRFRAGGGLTLASASKLCALVGLALLPVDGRKAVR